MSEHDDEMHALRNAAAVVLANVEHLAMMLKDADPERPLLEHETAERRNDALRSVSGAERAARQLGSALRQLRR